MVFVPEGQSDSSQARSAWVEMLERPRPGGTGEGREVLGGKCQSAPAPRAGSKALSVPERLQDKTFSLGGVPITRTEYGASFVVETKLMPLRKRTPEEKSASQCCST